jgi:hypothetical protein
MLMPTKRVLYSIQSEVVSRFNAVFKGRDRSRMVEQLMIQAIEARENEVAAAAKLIETDPAFAHYRQVSEWVDAQAIETLAHF